MTLLVTACAGERGVRDSGSARGTGDGREAPVERETVTPPRYPREQDLVEFFPGPIGSHRYFVDGSSLQVDPGGVVRYVSVVRATGGGLNVAFEAIRCNTREKRILAYGHGSNQWSLAKSSAWMPIRFDVANEYQAVLYREHFCPHNVVVANREAALRSFAGGVGAAVQRFGSD